LYLVEVDEVDLGGAAEVHGQVGREEVEEDEDGEQEADLVADGEAEQVGVGGELLHGPLAEDHDAEDVADGADEADEGAERAEEEREPRVLLAVDVQLHELAARRCGVAERVCVRHRQVQRLLEVVRVGVHVVAWLGKGELLCGPFRCGPTSAFYISDWSNSHGCHLEREFGFLARLRR
jgi:hypothetical protein